MDSLKQNLDAISLSPSKLQIYEGASSKINVSFYPAFTKADKKITWRSSNPKVATVENGVVKGVGLGSATILATSADGKIASVAVIVLSQELI